MRSVTCTEIKLRSMNKSDPSRFLPENLLELAIGRQVKEFRTRQHITVADLARQAGLSTGMLSRVENGQTSPSLLTLRALAKAPDVPVTSLFRQYEEIREDENVKAHQILVISINCLVIPAVICCRWNRT